jgi:hypothetical protein
MGGKDAVVEFLVSGYAPFTTVTSPWFRAMTGKLQKKAYFEGVSAGMASARSKGKGTIPKYKPTVFSVPSIKERLKEMANFHRAELKKRLKNQRVSITTDAWSAPNGGAYVCLTLHFIDEDMRMHTLSSGVMYLPGSHSAETCYAALMNMLRECGLTEDDVECLVTDTASLGMAASLM